MKKAQDEVLRLQGLVSELDRKLATAQGELGFLKDEHTDLPSDPTLTAQGLADHRKKVEAKERGVQGLLDDKANVERALAVAIQTELDTRQAHFHRQMVPEKMDAVLRLGRDVAKQMLDFTQAMKAEARRMENLNTELDHERKQAAVEAPSRESKNERAAHFVLVTLTQTLEMWQNVEKGFDQYAKGVGE